MAHCGPGRGFLRIGEPVQEGHSPCSPVERVLSCGTNPPVPSQSSVAFTAPSCARDIASRPQSRPSSKTDFGAEKVMSWPGSCSVSPSRVRRPRRRSVFGTFPSRTSRNRLASTRPFRPSAAAPVPCRRAAEPAAGRRPTPAGTAARHPARSHGHHPLALPLEDSMTTGLESFRASRKRDCFTVNSDRTLGLIRFESLLA